MKCDYFASIQEWIPDQVRDDRMVDTPTPLSYSSGLFTTRGNIFMRLPIHTQIEQELQRASSILLALPKYASIDSIASALLLQSHFSLLGKRVDLFCEQFETEKISFFSNLATIKQSLPSTKKTTIEINTKLFPIDPPTLFQTLDTLKITLSPKQGNISRGAISIKEQSHSYDLIVTLGTLDLSLLGSIYAENTDFFFETPIVNIDHRPDNQNYGQINWVDINATSISELIYHWIYAERMIQEDAANMLLAGIMSKTHSLRTAQVTPRTLELVAKLMQLGADHQLVVNHLYRTKSVDMLKLWGHVLHNLKSDSEKSLVWTMIPSSVFSLTGTSFSHLNDLTQEVINHTPEAKTIVLIYEDPSNANTIFVQLTTTPPVHAKDLLKNWQPSGSDRHALVILKNTTLKEAENQLLPLIKQRLASVIK